MKKRVKENGSVAPWNAPRVAARLENLLALDYPRDRLEIVLGSDGSTDGTVERARAYCTAHPEVGAFLLPAGAETPVVLGLTPDDLEPGSPD